MVAAFVPPAATVAMVRNAAMKQAKSSNISPNEVEDMAQEAALAYINRCKAHGVIKWPAIRRGIGWTIINQIRAREVRQRDSVSLDSLNEEFRDSFLVKQEAGFKQIEDRDRISKVISRLPRRFAEAAIAQAESKSERDAADSLGIPLNLFRYRLRRVRMLATQMEAL